MDSSSPRHRGGQPGNQNARKHGFYSQTFNSSDLLDLDDVDPTRLVKTQKLVSGSSADEYRDRMEKALLAVVAEIHAKDEARALHPTQ